MTRWTEAGADPLADLQAVHAHLVRGLSMGQAAHLVLHPANAVALGWRPGRAIRPGVLALAGARLTGQPSPVQGVVDDLVARHRGEWYAADPYAATGEAVSGEAILADLILADLVAAWMQGHDMPVTEWQLKALRRWFS